MGAGLGTATAVDISTEFVQARFFAEARRRSRDGEWCVGFLGSCIAVFRAQLEDANSPLLQGVEKKALLRPRLVSRSKRRFS